MRLDVLVKGSSMHRLAEEPQSDLQSLIGMCRNLSLRFDDGRLTFHMTYQGHEYTYEDDATAEGVRRLRGDLSRLGNSKHPFPMNYYGICLICAWIGNRSVEHIL